MKGRLNLLSDLDKAINKVKIFKNPEFENVYSKQYWENIIYPIFNDTNKKFTFIFGDFNKLGIINELYGHELGTKAMEYSLNLIRDSLPSDSIIVRLGGDEFCFIVPNLLKNECEKYIEAIHNSLELNSTLVSGLSIELASADSTEGTLSDLVSRTDLEVSKIKSSKKENDSPAKIISSEFIPLDIPTDATKEEAEKWVNINNHINVIIYNFLQDLRPSKNFEFTDEQIKNASYFIIDSISSLLNKKTQTNKDSEYSIPDNGDFNFNSTIDSKTAKLIHFLVTDKKSINLDLLSDFALKDLANKMNSLTENLIRDTNSGLFIYPYFKLFLVSNLVGTNEHMYSSYVSTNGIKLSNSAYGHDFTDSRLDKTNKEFLDLVYKKFEFNNKSFEYSPNSLYVIQKSAGDFLFIYSSDRKFEVESKLGNIISTINEKANIKDPYSSFMMSYAPMLGNNNSLPVEVLNTDSANNIIYSIKALNDMADFNKDPLKKSLFKSKDSVVAFEKLVTPLLDTYLQLPNTGSDIKRDSLLIRNFYRSLLNYEVNHNSSRIYKKSHSSVSKTFPDKDDFEK